MSISKADAYFSITSARKAANALHSSSVGVEHSGEVGLFSVRWQLFNGHLHFLVAELRTSCGFFWKCFLIHPIKLFKHSIFSCAVSFRKLTPNAGNRNAHFQQAVIDAGMSGILWMPFSLHGFSTPFRLALARLSPGIPCRRSCDFQSSMMACRKHITMKQKFSGSIPSAFDIQKRK